MLATNIRRHKPAAAIEVVIQFAKLFGTRTLAVEANGFQSLLKDQLYGDARAADAGLWIREVQNSADKHARIASLEPLVEGGRLFFGRDQETLLVTCPPEPDPFPGS